MFEAILPRAHSQWRLRRRHLLRKIHAVRMSIKTLWWNWRCSWPYPKQRNDESVGEYGERLALLFLRRRGYIILEHSYSCPLGEIDIIAAWENHTVVFIEVKTWGKQRSDPGRPAEAVDETKQRKISKTALHYAKRHALLDTPGRFDVIEIRLNESNHDFVHIQAAFESPDRFQLHS